MVDGSLATLHVVAGAPGSGKTAVLPRLVRRAQGPVVIDIDELLEDGDLLGVPIAHESAAPVWPAYDRMWSRIADLVRRAGHPVVLMRPTPSPDDLIAGQPWTPPARWALLDCADEVRRSRLQDRGWGPSSIDDALNDARQARELVPEVIDTSNRSLDVVADHILHWVRASTTAWSPRS